LLFITPAAALRFHAIISAVIDAIDYYHCRATPLSMFSTIAIDDTLALIFIAAAIYTMLFAITPCHSIFAIAFLSYDAITLSLADAAATDTP